MYRNSCVFFPNLLRQWLTSCPTACWRSWYAATPFECSLSLLASLSVSFLFFLCGRCWSQKRYMAVKCVTVTPSGHQARFAFQRFHEQGQRVHYQGSNLVIVTAEFSSQGRKDLISINAGVAKFAVAVAALIVQPVNLAHQT